MRGRPGRCCAGGRAWWPRGSRRAGSPSGTGRERHERDRLGPAGPVHDRPGGRRRRHRPPRPGEFAGSFSGPSPPRSLLACPKTRTGSYGHTNNTVYHVWCERVAWAHSREVGLGPEAWQSLDRAMAMRSSQALFLAPSFLGDEVRVGNWIVACDGRLRAARRFQIVRIADGATLMQAQSEWVCIEIATGRPKRMPEEFRRAYVVEPAVVEALARGRGGPFAWGGPVTGHAASARNPVR
ncbi:MAG TPA: acyl-CoA thioesterase [Thermoanaerobaculia bacterium]|nr:acyl-CoA thioesterase [Thermoanaerobaculia bacterium]